MMDIFSVKRRMAVGDPLWWSLDGMSKANCLGAWKFKARNNQTEAFKDLTGNGYSLSNTNCTWGAGGVSVPAGGYLDNSSLRSSAKSIVIKVESSWAGYMCPLSGGWGNINLWLAIPFCTKSFAYVAAGVGIGHQNGLSVLYDGGTLPMSYVQITSAAATGVFGFTLSGEALYRNGSAVSKTIAHHDSYGGDTQWTGFIAADIPRLIGGRAHGTNTGKWNSEGNLPSAVGNFVVSAFSVYDKALSQAEHQLIYKNMLFI